ncbi:MAG: ABC transporter ATP-binding protein/permease [Oscillospiraceae bacterium]|nr:ABC transporter ATP-binding protein/permease [Oscillospiraceae bacterium]
MIKALKHLRPIAGTVALSVLFVVFVQALSLALPLLMSLIINNGIAAGDIEYIKKTGLVMAAVSALNILVSVLSSYFTSKTSAAYGKIMREKIFLKVESLSHSDIEHIGTPSLITRCTNDVKVLQDFLLQGMRMILAAPVMLVGGTVMAFILNAKLAMIIFAIIPIIALLCFVVVKIVMPLFKKRQKLTDEVNSFLREKLSGIRVIWAFNTSEKEDERFEDKNRRLSALVLKFQRTMSVILPLCITLVIASLVLLVYIASKNIDALTDTVKIQNTVGDLQAFLLYMMMVVFAVTIAAAMFVIVPRANISAGRINEVLAIEPEIKDSENPEDIVPEKRGKVEFDNVTFGYEDASPVLKNISFTAEKGQVTAIIGSTGSGKSTLVSLITRFYDVTDGRVLFDGTDVRKLPQKTLHSLIGYVTQKATLFSGSIRDNLLYGDENATDERLRLALDISQSSEFVDKLPDGLESRISQSGTNLSGGQKQRLSIARALVRQADVYIFDDSFSALDFRTDARVRKAIKEKLDATVIIVAQRVGTIIDADKIIVLDEGGICGIGTHSELLNSCPVYREIAESQLTKEALS